MVEKKKLWLGGTGGCGPLMGPWQQLPVALTVPAQLRDIKPCYGSSHGRKFVPSLSLIQELQAKALPAYSNFAKP